LIVAVFFDLGWPRKIGKACLLPPKDDFCTAKRPAVLRMIQYGGATPMRQFIVYRVRQGGQLHGRLTVGSRFTRTRCPTVESRHASVCYALQSGDEQADRDES